MIDRRKVPQPGKRPPVERNRAPWTEAMLDYMYAKREESGEFIWINTDELISYCTRFVPTGVAARRLYRRTDAPIDDDEMVIRIARSARWIAKKVISVSKYLEHDNGMTRYRLYKGEKHA